MQMVGGGQNLPVLSLLDWVQVVALLRAYALGNGFRCCATLCSGIYASLNPHHVHSGFFRSFGAGSLPLDTHGSSRAPFLRRSISSPFGWWPGFWRRCVAL